MSSKALSPVLPLRTDDATYLLPCLLLVVDVASGPFSAGILSLPPVMLHEIPKTPPQTTHGEFLMSGYSFRALTGWSTSLNHLSLFSYFENIFYPYLPFQRDWKLPFCSHCVSFSKHSRVVCGELLSIQMIF